MNMREDGYAELSVICMRGCEEFAKQVDYYLKEWRSHDDQTSTYIIDVDCPRFGSGEGKAIIHDTLRGHDTYIFADVFNYGVTYKMYGQTVPMSPDDHFQDLKRVIAATGGTSFKQTFPKKSETTMTIKMMYNTVFNGAELDIKPEYAAKVIELIEACHAQNPLPVKFD